MSAGSSELVYMRVSAVDKAMRERGWNVEIANSLAKELNLDVRTIYRYRKMALRWTQTHLRPTDLERWKQEHLVLADSGARTAMQAGDFTGAAALIKVAGQIVGTIATPGVKVDINVQNNVVHNTAIANLSQLSSEELRQLVEKPAPREILDGEAVEIEADATPRSG